MAFDVSGILSPFTRSAPPTPELTHQEEQPESNPREELLIALAKVYEATEDGLHKIDQLTMDNQGRPYITVAKDGGQVADVWLETSDFDAVEEYLGKLRHKTSQTTAKASPNAQALTLQA